MECEFSKKAFVKNRYSGKYSGFINHLLESDDNCAIFHCENAAEVRRVYAGIHAYVLRRNTIKELGLSRRKLDVILYKKEEQ